jgi:hypothetical protein
MTIVTEPRHSLPLPEDTGLNRKQCTAQLVHCPRLGFIRMLLTMTFIRQISHCYFKLIVPDNGIYLCKKNMKMARWQEQF